MLKISNTLPGYNVNSMGYRTEEFNTIDWANSYIIQGCSACFGLGIVDDQNTIARQLSQRIGKPVINLGVSGSSIELQYFNTIELIEHGIRPLGVFMMWPNADRFPMFNNDELENCGAWSSDETLQWALNGNSAQHNFYHSRAVKLLWSALGVPFIDFGHHPEAKPYVDVYLEDYLDRGTDGEHWGTKTAEYIAEMLYQKHLLNLR